MSCCADPITLKPLPLCVAVVQKLKFILGRSLKVKNSIEDTFK
jgi:hypothetical protein